MAEEEDDNNKKNNNKKKNNEDDIPESKLKTNYDWECYKDTGSC